MYPQICVKTIGGVPPNMRKNYFDHTPNMRKNYLGNKKASKAIPY